MKTLILYATKHGAAQEAARMIADAMGGATLCDLAKDPLPSLGDADAIVVGGSVYAGMLRKEARAFLRAHAQELCQKPLGLYLCCLSESGLEGYLTSNVPAPVLAHAKATAVMGGVCDPQKFKALERLVVKLAAKQSGYLSTLEPAKAQAFAQAMLRA